LNERNPLRLQQNGFFVGNGVGRIADGRLNRFTGEPRVGIEQVSFRRTLGELSQNQFHRNAGPADDRLPHHDFGVDFDMIGDRHGRPHALCG
jgi:hypothetical protein